MYINKYILYQCRYTLIITTKYLCSIGIFHGKHQRETLINSELPRNLYSQPLQGKNPLKPTSDIYFLCKIFTLLNPWFTAAVAMDYTVSFYIYNKILKSKNFNNYNNNTNPIVCIVSLLHINLKLRSACNKNKKTYEIEIRSITTGLVLALTLAYVQFFLSILSICVDISTDCYHLKLVAIIPRSRKISTKPSICMAN